MERNSRKVIKMLKKDGWREVAAKGDHVQIQHPAMPGRVAVPHPSKDIKAGTVMSFCRQAGWRYGGLRARCVSKKEANQAKGPSNALRGVCPYG
ncbi:MAG: type II toxin-antitoxin system HicA family toxin [Boseongicola sp. SB0673_bin_14]|nr:type II toxin-antitoxin system HicA family toxin [Boseongicola sp. SB0667_bin_21]MYI70671.1 type II toxin-antitoxin system HicA family toxin [Boseongicola sp. SB0673_bin_14]